MNNKIKQEIIDEINENIYKRKEGFSTGKLLNSISLDFLVEDGFDWQNFEVEENVIVKDNNFFKIALAITSFVCIIMALAAWLYQSDSKDVIIPLIIAIVTGLGMFSPKTFLTLDANGFKSRKQNYHSYKELVFANFITKKSGHDLKRYLVFHLANGMTIKHDLSNTKMDIDTLGMIVYTKIKTAHNKS